MQKIGRQVGDYLAYCEKVRGMSATTLVCKKNILERFTRVTGLAELGLLTNEVFDGWVAWLREQGVSARSVNAYNAVVLAMVRYYREMGEAIPLKIALVSKLKEGAVMRRFYTFEEVERVVREADFETGLMIKVMFETGMRIAELARLKVADFTGRRVRFLAKGRKMREAYVRKETWREVCKLASQRGITGDKCLFGGTLNGEPLTTATVRRRLEMAFSAVGFKGFYPHSLRHSFATHLQLKGASVAEIKEMIGHESVATTERYLHGFEGRLEELFDRYLG